MVFHFWQISLLEVPYSEHSSYSELERFLKFLRIKDVSQVEPCRRFSKGGSFFLRNIPSLPVAGGANCEQTGLPEHGEDVPAVDRGENQTGT